MSPTGNIRHPQHDQLCAEVRSWYRASAPELGYRVVYRGFGFYGRQGGNPHSARIIIERPFPSEIAMLQADARKFFGDVEVDIWIDSPETDATLGPALLRAGCHLRGATTYLAHVGEPPSVKPLSNVSVEPVSAALLKEFATVKLKGFGNTEDQPSAERVALEVASRAAELRGSGRCLLARIGDEAVAIIGYYEGKDRLVFNLATRVPFRNTGVARLLLSTVLTDGYQRRCRSVIINTDPADTPINWYRRLGFTDEVYWHRSYLYRPIR
jgi:GNAT superfamily N-acetyltransferase